METDGPIYFEHVDEEPTVYNHNDTDHAPSRSQYLLPLAGFALMAVFTFATILGANSSKPQTTSSRAAENNIITVCPTGTAGQNGCDYIGGDGIQQAVDSVPDNNPLQKTILVKSGNYTRQSFIPLHLRSGFTKFFVTVTNKNIILQGQRDSIIDGSKSSKMNGIYVSGGNVQIVGLTVQGFDYENGGRCPNENDSCSWGRGIYIEGNTRVNIKDNIVMNNQGFGLTIFDSPSAEVANNIFINSGWLNIDVNNSAVSYIHNNTLYNLFVPYSGTRSQIQIMGTSNVTLKNNLISSSSYQGINEDSSHTGKVDMQYNDSFNNTLGNYTGKLAVRTCTGKTQCPYVWQRDHNLSVDPLFKSTDPNNPNFLHLQDASPVRHAGDPSILNPDGTRSDMGAYGGPGACGLDSNLPGCNGTPAPTVPLTLPMMSVFPTSPMVTSQITPIGVTVAPTAATACVPPKYVYCKSNANCCGGVGYRCNADHQCESTSGYVAPPVKR